MIRVFFSMARNFIKYLRKGGVVYMNFTTVNYPQVFENKHFVICGGGKRLRLYTS